VSEGLGQRPLPPPVLTSLGQTITLRSTVERRARS